MKKLFSTFVISTLVFLGFFAYSFAATQDTINFINQATQDANCAFNTFNNPIPGCPPPAQTTQTQTSSGPTCKIGQTPSNFKDLVMNLFIGCLITPLYQIILGLSAFIFVWGIFKYIRSEGNEKETGKQYMFWGIVGIFVLVSMWALVGIIQSTFNFNPNTNITPKEVTF